MQRRWMLAVGLLSVCAIALIGTMHSCTEASNTTKSRAISVQPLPRSSATPTSPFEVTWAEGVLDAANMYFPLQLEVLEVIPSTPTKQHAIDLATRLGYPPSTETLAQLPDLDVAKEGSYFGSFGPVHIDIFFDGNIGLYWPDRDLVSEHFKNPQLKITFTDEQAKAIADRFLQETGLLPEGSQVTEVIPKTAITRTDITGKDQTTVVSRSVVYRRFRSGFPEGSMGVTINGNGEIVKVNKNMRNVRVIGHYPLLRPDEASAMIWTSTARVSASANAPGYTSTRGAIEKVRMEYYEGATGWRYETIQPIYIFTGTGWDSSNRPHAFTAMVPAVRPEYLLVGQ